MINPKPRTILAILVAVILSVLYVGGVHLFVRSRQAKIIQDPEYWATIARNEVYGVCYYGCADCLEVESIADACSLTTRAHIPNVICDARTMWTWKDKYPPECLLAIGGIMKQVEFRRRTRWYWLCVAAPVLFVPIGIWIASTLRSKRVLSDWRSLAKGSRSRPRIVITGATANATTPLLSAGSVSLLMLSFLAHIQPAHANWGYYPCINGAVYNQFFVSETVDGPLYAVAHGWLSTCYQETYSCGETCVTASSTKDCTANECTREVVYEQPHDFVRSARHRIQSACGLQPVISVPVALGERIANANIERWLRVGIWVDRFNSSTGSVYDQVMCLYDKLVEPYEAKARRQHGWGRMLWF